MTKLDYHFVGRLIENLEFHQLRVVGMEAMKLYLGSLVHISDGWNDGGSDLTLQKREIDGSHVAVQLSVQREWRAKLDADVAKARKKLKATAFYFVSTRKVDNTSRLELERDLREKHKVFVSLLGRDEIASILVEKGADNVIYGVIGIPEHVAASASPSLRDKALYSYVALSDDVHDFKDKVVDRTILAQMAEYGGPQTREGIVECVSGLLGVPSDQALRIRTRFSSLQSRGIVIGRDSQGFELSGAAKSEWADMSRALLAEKRILYELVRNTLSRFSKKAIDGNLVQSIAHLATDALLQQELVDAQQVSVTLCLGELLRVVGNPIQDLLIKLSGSPIPKDKLEECARSLVDAISGNTVARGLMCSALYFCLQAVSQPAATRILADGKAGGVMTHLDTSVILPAICERLFGPSTNPYSGFSAHAMERFRHAGAKLIFPQWYLEEAASHLLRAFRYGELPERDTDLVYSQNAFVAHFSGMIKRPERTFVEYLEEFARIDIGRIDTDFVAVRLQAERGIRDVLKQYDIEIEHLPDARAEAMKEFEQKLTWILKERHEQRSPVLLRHDVQVLCHLQRQSQESSAGVSLLTWDAAIGQLGKEDRTIGWILNPAIASDLFELENPVAGVGLSQLSTNLARQLGGARVEGARILDRLLLHARTDRIDAEYRKEARKFKEEFVSRTPPDSVEPRAYHRKFEDETRAFLESMDAVKTDADGT